MMSEPLQRLKFFCLTHLESCVTQRATPLPMCEQGPHSLTENFPRDKWEYCCACESFFARDDHQPAHAKCPSCERVILARYLCDACDTLSFETELPPPQRGFAFSADGLPAPACPCCLGQAQSPTVEHLCASERGLRAPFRSARRQCPFCGDWIVKVQEVPPTRPLTQDLTPPPVVPSPQIISFPLSFEKPVSNYLQGLNGKAIKTKPTFSQPQVLMESDDGHLWMTRFRDDDSFIVFPGISGFDSEQDFAYFQMAFECANPSMGELVISAPAVARLNPAARTWTITQKGKLKVLADPTQNAPSPPPEFLKETDPLIPASSMAKSKTPIYIGAAVAAGAVIAIALYFFFASPKRQIISKVKQGQIVTPAGNSAYDLFLSSNLSDGDRAEVRTEIRPILDARGNEVIRQLVSDGYNPSAPELDNTAKIYSWLDTLSPQSSYSARKHYFQGRTAYERQDWSTAENEFRQAMNQDPSWALPVNTLARVFMRRKDFYGAQTCYLKAIELDPNWMFPRINLCVLAVENLKNWSLGEQTCRGLLQLDQNKTAGYYFLGRSLEEQGSKCDALRQFRIAIEKASSTTNPGFNVDNLRRRLPKLESQCSL